MAERTTSHSFSGLQMLIDLADAATGAVRGFVPRARTGAWTNLQRCHAQGRQVYGVIVGRRANGMQIKIDGFDAELVADDIDIFAGAHKRAFVVVRVHEINDSAGRVLVGPAAPPSFTENEIAALEKTPVSGQVVSTTSDGAYVDLEPGAIGFLRRRGDEVFEPGQSVTVRIATLNRRAGRVDLERASMGDARLHAPLKRDFRVGQIVPLRVTAVNDAGVNVAYGEGGAHETILKLDAFDTPSELRPGTVIESLVTNVSAGKPAFSPVALRQRLEREARRVFGGKEPIGVILDETRRDRAEWLGSLQPGEPNADAAGKQPSPPVSKSMIDEKTVAAFRARAPELDDAKLALETAAIARVLYDSGEADAARKLYFECLLDPWAETKSETDPEALAAALLTLAEMEADSGRATLAAWDATAAFKVMGEMAVDDERENTGRLAAG